MIFIGVVSDNKKFEVVKKLIYKNKNKNEITLININNKSIDNLKNIKFKIVVFLDIPGRFKENDESIEEVCKGTNFLIVNSDIEFPKDSLKNIKANIITFGFNHLATVTFSSVTNESLLISVQRNFPDISGFLVDVGEYSFSIDKADRNYIYEALVCYIIMALIAENQ